MLDLAEKYLRKDALPTIFCPGCGDGQILNATIKAIDDLKIRKNIASVSGIGCSGWIPVYLDMDVLHSIHGRAVAAAEGLKLSSPDKKILVFTGDGDCVGIGGNHFIHAARRNIDLTVIMVNNFIYGMTGGQKAPTTPLKAVTKTSPYGNSERAFDASRLAITAGATYVARWATIYPNKLEAAIKNGIEHEGFSFIEVLSQCPVQTGKYIMNETNPWNMMNWFKENTEIKNNIGEKNSEKIRLGEFINEEEEEFSTQLAEVRRKFNENNN